MALQLGIQLASSQTNNYLTDAKYVRGGYLAVEDIAAIDARWYDKGEGGVIVEGTLCYDIKTETFFKYTGEDWEELEFATDGDEKTITLDDNQKLTLKDFGKAYYKYVAKTETEEAHYEKVTGFKAGLQPQISSEDGQLVLTWYEPNPTTVEGLEAEISALSTSVSDLSDLVGNKATETEEATGIFKELDEIKEEWPVQSIVFTSEQFEITSIDDSNLDIKIINVTDEQDAILSDLRYSAINIDATASGMLPKGTIYRNGDVDADGGYAFLLDLISGPASDISDIRMEAVYDSETRTVTLTMFSLATENYVEGRLSDHVNDTTILHVTADEKTAWNAKQEQVVAGEFISIAEDNKTISVDFTGLILDGGTAEDWTETNSDSSENESTGE